MARKRTVPSIRRPRRGESGVAIDDNRSAMIWTLTEEGMSRRGIAKQLNISARSVGRVLSKDPVRLEDLRIAQREARSQKWQRVEELGLDELIGWLERTRDIRIGKRKPRDSDALVPSFLRALRSAAESGTKATELLQGGVTERMGKESTSELTDSPEALIEQAIALNIVDRLPPLLREAAQRRLSEQAAE